MDERKFDPKFEAFAAAFVESVFAEGEDKTSFEGTISASLVGIKGELDKEDNVEFILMLSLFYVVYQLCGMVGKTDVLADALNGVRKKLDESMFTELSSKFQGESDIEGDSLGDEGNESLQ